VSRDWNEVFNSWAKPLSDSEAEKAERAERLVREAIDASEKLKTHSIRVFAQGSYKNDTNARLESDVDISVCCTDVFIPDYTHAPGVTTESLGNKPSSYTRQQLKNEVGEALTDYFGAAGVTRGNKVFEVHENSVRLDADVAPTFELRLYKRDQDGQIILTRGTNLHPDSGGDIWNFPDQHYERGKAKNIATNLHFKRLVRIFKRLRNEMAGGGNPAAALIASYFLECLLFNCPNEMFEYSTYYDDAHALLLDLYQNLSPDGPAEKWLEVNQEKYLFHRKQSWTMQQGRDFVTAAWNYMGYE
jgi:hypothetical protein